MKQIFKMVVVGVALLGFGAWADVITITPPDADMWDLDHAKAYKWNLNLNQYTGTSGTVKSATLYIDNVTNNMEPENNDILNGYLLDLTGYYRTNSVTTFKDLEDPSGFFVIPNPTLGWNGSTLIGSFSDVNGADETNDLAWNIDASVLSQYMSNNGGIGIGLDPDCHYNNSKVRLVINVPEPSSLSMLFLGFSLLGGFAFFRRRKN
jgi:hypothetical protein